MLEIKGYTLIEVLISLAIFLILASILINFSGQLFSLLEIQSNRLRLQREVNLAGEVLLANLGEAIKIVPKDNKLHFYNQAGDEKEIYLNKQGLYLNDDDNLISQYISDLDISIEDNLIHLQLTGKLAEEKLSVQTALRNKGVENE